MDSCLKTCMKMTHAHKFKTHPPIIQGHTDGTQTHIWHQYEREYSTYP